MGRPNWPWQRKDRPSWLCTINGKQVRLHEDRDIAFEKFYELMRQLGRDPRPPGLQSKPKPDDESWRQIYFIRNTVNGCIKIGQTMDVRKRLKALQLANSDPLELMGFVVAQIAYENRLHRKFRQFHARGEWFCGDPELIAFIDVLLMKTEA